MSKLTSQINIFETTCLYHIHWQTICNMPLLLLLLYILLTEMSDNSDSQTNYYLIYFVEPFSHETKIYNEFGTSKSKPEDSRTATPL